MYPLNYIEPVFRPPSEAQSLILQVTNGCSWNQCTFCDMYTASQKQFKPKSQKEIEKDIQLIAKNNLPVRRIFLADGDVMTLSIRRLQNILLSIRDHLPNVQRVSAYCLPRNLRHKSAQNLVKLQTLGLRLLYIGCESGDDKVLAAIHKGETFASSLNALLKIKQAGIKSSVMILNGMGGQQFSKQHAINTAQLMNQTQPDYLATLVVTLPKGLQRVQAGFGGNFSALDQFDLFQEIYWLLEELELKKTIFRSDHASNYLVLKGVLNKDKIKLLTQVNHAMEHPNQTVLRAEWQRGL